MIFTIGLGTDTIFACHKHAESFSREPPYRKTIFWFRAHVLQEFWKESLNPAVVPDFILLKTLSSSSTLNGSKLLFTSPAIFWWQELWLLGSSGTRHHLVKQMHGIWLVVSEQLQDDGLSNFCLSGWNWGFLPPLTSGSIKWFDQIIFYEWRGTFHSESCVSIKLLLFAHR